jgi:beta-N-acetylhexosaminidase
VSTSRPNPRVATMALRHALAQIEVFQAHGLAATAKHWPGEGFDDRDQHLVTTVNPLSMEEWEANFGTLYRAAINAGVLSVMSAHIALPAFIREQDPGAGLEAFRPASVSHALNIDLLRGRLGFNGVIVSDASVMGGLGAWSSLTQAKVDIIANGCDIILFSFNPEGERQAVLDAVASGRISAARLQDAVTRVLGLKAALGLHLGRGLPQPDGLSRMGTPASKEIAAATFRRAPTLVKDTQNLLPLNPAKHQRILIISGGIVSPIHPDSTPFVLPDLLAARGFAVTLFQPGTRVNPADYDLVLYLFGEETLLTRSRIFIDWAKLMGGFEGAMTRFWHDVPTAMISFGYPYYLYDAPRVPTYINAYSTLDDAQAAVVELMLGNADWNRSSPVDPFCGLQDAHY